MCGIALSFTPQTATPVAALAAMCAAMRHRGPDDEGYLLWDATLGTRLLGGADTPAAVMREPTPWRPSGWVADEPRRAAPLLMGHRRLAIVELSPWGHQPMVRGHWQIVFNGEIYNHIELRAELEGLGHHFKGDSDTEVLLAALGQWGTQAFARCNGMWALVALDTQRRRLLVARDRFGVKPLYLWQGPGAALVMASEIKALLAHPLVPAAPSLVQVDGFLRHGPQAWQAETEFAGITRFPAGHFAEIELDAPAALAPQAFWRHPLPTARDEPFTPERALEIQARYQELLASAVAQRMRVDVRFGTALSGGLDSSSIAVLVNAELRRRGALDKQEVFSSVYRSPQTQGADESAYIDQVVAQLDVRSNRIEPRVADVPAAHERMIWAMDTPPANSLMSSWHTFALVARRGVVVTLDGQGADEQLAGYTRYVRNRLAHAPLADALVQACALSGGLHGFGSAVAVGLASKALRSVAGTRALAAVVRQLHMGADPSATLGEALARDFQTHLQNLLLYADKTAMAWSVESRMPFMDYRLVEFLATVGDAYKIHAGWTKWLARSAFATQLPAEVAWRRDKMGWAIPEPAWFKGPLAPWLQQQIDGSAFATEAAARARIGATASLPTRLRLLNLARWHGLFFEEPGRPGRPLGRGMPLGDAP